MAKIDRVQEVSVEKLKPYEKNAKVHSEDQVQKIADSIQEFGFISPCLIDNENRIIAGHGRVMAAKLLGMKTVPCVYVEGLTDAQRRAYILADNRLTELGDWDWDTVSEELGALRDMDFEVTLTGFDVPDTGDWFENRERFDRSREEGNEEYNAFLDKFEQPKTTDDCYTPDNIYDVVADYAAEMFNVSRDDFVRPFYPGGDYQKERYKPESVVVDNPPFSILSQIVDWYQENGVKFFLFAPAVSTFTYLTRDHTTAICPYAKITYENGANVMTNFITNLGDGSLAAIGDPDLFLKLDEANTENEEKMHVHFPKYDYPYHLLTAAKLGWMVSHGVRFEVTRKDSLFVRELDAMKESGKSIYGGGLLLAERAAAERAAAERAAAERLQATVWELSDREWELVRSLG